MLHTLLLFHAVPETIKILSWGARGREFESHRPDQESNKKANLPIGLFAVRSLLGYPFGIRFSIVGHFLWLPGASGAISRSPTSQAD